LTGKVGFIISNEKKIPDFIVVIFFEKKLFSIVDEFPQKGRL